MRCTRDAPEVHQGCTRVRPFCISGASLVHLWGTSCTRLAGPKPSLGLKRANFGRGNGLASAYPLVPPQTFGEPAAALELLVECREASWTAAVICRFRGAACCPKAADDCRSPRRFATLGSVVPAGLPKVDIPPGAPVLARVNPPGPKGELRGNRRTNGAG
jgi:hypothetical protein